MATNVDDKIKKLSSARRNKVEARAAELIAEEMTLRELRHARKLTQVRIAKNWTCSTRFICPPTSAAPRVRLSGLCPGSEPPGASPQNPSVRQIAITPEPPQAHTRFGPSHRVLNRFAIAAPNCWKCLVFQV
jgi:hypothetical protein